MSKTILYSIAFLTGFAVMAYEILGVRVLSPYYGSSVHVWGAIISVFLAGLSIGYAAGGRFADKNASIRTLSKIIIVPSALIVLFPFYGYFICNLFFNHVADSKLGALLLSIALFMLPCAFMGAVVPVLVKMLATDSGLVGAAAGNVYSVSTAGSIAGTIFTSFFLISLVSVSKGIMLTGFLLAACWFLCLIYDRAGRL
ncbi:MAG: fused MFS/spermidine synthase [Victivallales bacterium]|jgi:predicted membrane-bound spermidine synthase